MLTFKATVTSFARSVLRAVIAAGFTTADDGSVTSPTGAMIAPNNRRKTEGRRHYYTVSVTLLVGGKKRHTVPIHRLVAYRKYGEEALFAPGIEVRHRDGDHYNNRSENILIGTHRVSPNKSGYGPAFRTAVVADYATGLSLRAVARLQGCSLGTVRQILRREGVALRGLGHGPAFVARIVADHASGLGCTRISKLRGCSPSTVRSILRREGVTITRAEDRTRSAIPKTRTKEERSASAMRSARSMTEEARSARSATAARGRYPNTVAPVGEARLYGPAFRATIVADYASGLGCRRIAQLRQCSPTIVCRALKREGVTIRASKYRPQGMDR